MVGVTTLSGLLSQLGGESPERVVALTGEQERTVGELLSDVGALSNGLREREEREWGIYLEDAFDFLTAFLALLQAGKRPILLPNKQPDFLERLDLQAVLLQGEFEALKAHSNKDIPGAVSGQGMSLYTSGSTGKPKEIGKTLNNLEAEIQNLETVFGSQLADAVVLSTVSHQHIYGLLFQVLWPVCAGRVFDSRAQFFPSSPRAGLRPVFVGWSAPALVGAAAFGNLESGGGRGLREHRNGRGGLSYSELFIKLSSLDIVSRNRGADRGGRLSLPALSVHRHHSMVSHGRPGPVRGRRPF